MSSTLCPVMPLEICFFVLKRTVVCKYQSKWKRHFGSSYTEWYFGYWTYNRHYWRYSMFNTLSILLISIRQFVSLCAIWKVVYRNCIGVGAKSTTFCIYSSYIGIWCIAFVLRFHTSIDFLANEKMVSWVD